MNDENIFQKACLVQLSTGCWQGCTALAQISWRKLEIQNGSKALRF